MKKTAIRRILALALTWMLLLPGFAPSVLMESLDLDDELLIESGEGGDDFELPPDDILLLDGMDDLTLEVNDLDASLVSNAAATEPQPFEQSVAFEDVTVSVTAAAGVLPDGACIRVSDVIEDDAARAAREAAEAALPGKMVEHHLYDIELLDRDGNPVLPGDALPVVHIAGLEITGEMRVFACGAHISCETAGWTKDGKIEFNLAESAIYDIADVTGEAEQLQEPEGQSEKPEGQQQPEGQSEQPEEQQQPEEQAQQPGNDALDVDGALLLGDALTVDGVQPGDGTEQPGDGTEQPGDDAEQPGDDTEQPGDDAEQPGDDTEQPGDDAEQPGDDAPPSAEDGDTADETDDTEDQKPSPLGKVDQPEAETDEVPGEQGSDDAQVNEEPPADGQGEGETTSSVSPDGEPASQGSADPSSLETAHSAVSDPPGPSEGEASGNDDTTDEPTDAQTAHPVTVIFNAAPETAIITVYPVSQASSSPDEDQAEADEVALEDISGQPAPIPAESGNTYALLPGAYVYSASAEGYVSVESVPFTVEASEEAVTVSFELKPAEPASGGEELLLLDEEEAVAEDAVMTGANGNAGQSEDDPIEVDTWAALQAALGQGGSTMTYIRLTDNLKAGQDDGWLRVAGKKFTIDLNGKDIDANGSMYAFTVKYVNGELIITGSGEIKGAYDRCVDVNNYARFTLQGGAITGNGGGVSVTGCAIFTLQDGGAITHNGSDDTEGGGVYVSGGTFEMSGGEISGNTAENGGGVYVEDIDENISTFNLSGGEISGNSASSYGGGVQVDADVIFKMSGNPRVFDNTAGGNPSNVELNKTITIDGILTSGCNVGVTWKGSGAFTSGYKNNMGDTPLDPANCFFSDDSAYIVGWNDNQSEAELKIVTGDDIPYREYDLTNQCFTTKTKEDCSPVYSEDDEWDDGCWYCVDDPDVKIDGRVTVSGDVHLILCDGATLTVEKGITVASDATLTIYGQAGTGKLIAGKADACYAGIGGENNKNSGSVVIHGGHVTATGDNGGAGIGGGYNGNGGSVTIYGGRVTATGGFAAAGIGGGSGTSAGGQGGNVTIYGGTVIATGNDGGAGIGGGSGGTGTVTNGRITICGGNVTAIGGSYGAGIGGSSQSFGTGENGSIEISGGTVVAKGGACAAGIGGGNGFFNLGHGTGKNGRIIISGGRVTAIGGNTTNDHGAGAGIGGGCSDEISTGGGTGENGSIIISGGTVEARGGNGDDSHFGGPGIGGFVYKEGETITISGGSVTAIAGSGKSGSVGIDGGSKSATKADITLSYTDETRAGMSVTASSYVGTVKLLHDFKDKARTPGNTGSFVFAATDDNGITDPDIRAIMNGRTIVPCGDAHAIGLKFVMGNNEADTTNYNTATSTMAVTVGGETVDVPVSKALPGSTIKINVLPGGTNGENPVRYALSAVEETTTPDTKLVPYSTVMAAATPNTFIMPNQAATAVLTQWAWVQREIDAAAADASHGPVELPSDVTAQSWEAAQTVPSGKPVVLDLKGHALDRAMEEPEEEGQVITVQKDAKLTVNDTGTGGTITGGKSSGSGGGVIVDGGSFKLEGGAISGNWSDSAGVGVGEAEGGGVYLKSGTFEMTGGDIIRNRAGSGGGVYVYEGTFTMKDGFIGGKGKDGNTAVYGGGVYLFGGSFQMDGGAVTGNAAEGGVVSHGGGVYVYSHNSFTMTGGTIYYNSAADSGGGVFVDNGVFTLQKDGVITGNNAGQTGGGVHVECGTFTMSGGEIIDNRATRDEGAGGGVYVYGFSDTGVYRGVFAMSGGKIGGDEGNLATSGGGVYVEGGRFDMSGSATITNNGALVGGGVCLTDNEFQKDAMFSVSGGAQVTGNTARDKAGNVFLAKEKRITVADRLSGASFGVTTEQEPVEYDGGLTITKGLKQKQNSEPSAFTSDNPAYAVGWSADGMEAVLGMPMTVTAKDYEDEYDGEAHGIDVMVAVPASHYTVKYGDREGNYSWGELKYTDAGTYTVYFQVTASGYVPFNGSATVKIEPIDGVKVIITGNTDKVIFDEAEHIVKGYTFKASTPLYKENNFTFTGKAEARQTIVGTTNMGLESSQFKNTNPNFTNVSFQVKDGWIMVGPWLVDGIDGTMIIVLEETRIEYNGLANQPLENVFARRIQQTRGALANAANGDVLIPENEYTVSYEHNIDAGTAKVIITDVPGGNFVVNGETTFTIDKRPVTVTAADQTVKAGESIQTGTGQVKLTGQVEGHTLKSVNLTSTSTAKATPSGEITPSGAVIVDANGNDVTKNYAISYAKGALTVTGEASKADYTLLAQLKVCAHTGLRVTWTKVEGADGYDVYFAKNDCGFGKPVSVTKGLTCKFTGLDKKTVYKAYVQAWKKEGGKKTPIGKASPTVCAVTGNADKKRTNAAKVTVKKARLTLKVGKSETIKASVKGAKSGKTVLKQDKKLLRYYSSDRNVATVNKSGKVKAVGKGSCTIWVIAANGKRVGVKVKVK